MGNIPRFERNVVSQQTVFENPAAIQGQYEQASRAIGQGVDYILNKAQRQQDAADFTSVNEVGMKAQAELNDAMEAFQRQNSSNPDKKYADFDKIVAEKVKGYRDTLKSENAKLMFDKYGINLRQNYQGRMQSWEDETKAFNFAQSVENAAEINNKMAFMDGNLANLDKYVGNAQSTVLAGATVVAPERLDGVRKKTVGGAVKALLMGAGEKNPAQARAALKNENFNKYLDADDIMSMDNHFESLAKKYESDAREAKSRQSTGVLNALKGKMAEGIDVSQEAHDQYKAGVIDGGQLLTVVNAQRKFNTTQANLQAGREKMGLVLNGQAALNPSDKGDMAALDDYYTKTFAPTITDMSPDQQARAVSDFVGQTGVMPITLKSEVQASLMSGTPEQQLKSADFLSNVINDNPRVASQIDAKTLGYAMKLNDLSNAGVPPAEAIKAAQQQSFLGGTPQYAARVEEYNQASGKTGDLKFDPGAFTQWFRNDPGNVPSEMKRQWDALAKQAFVDYGATAENAMKLANAQILKTWSVTNIGRGGEGQWMQYAPEAYYGGGTDWIQKQLTDDLAEAGVLKTKDPGRLGVDNANERGAHRREVEEFMKTAYLVPVPNNLSKSGNPTYYVYRETDGVQNVVLATNPKTGIEEAIIFEPDYNNTSEGKRIKRDAEKARERANAKADEAYQRLLNTRRGKAYQDENPDVSLPTSPFPAGNMPDENATRLGV